MKKACNRSTPVSRADVEDTLSQRFSGRNGEFDVSGRAKDSSGAPEEADDVFLMNRFYGKQVLEPLLAHLKTPAVGEAGPTLARRLEEEMETRQGMVRGDVLWKWLKEEMGMETAAALIGQLDDVNGLGLYEDQIVARFQNREEKPLIAKRPMCRRRQVLAAGGDQEEIRQACRGCRDHTGEKGGVIAKWKWKKR